MNLDTETIEHSAPEINPEHYRIPATARCKKHGMVVPSPRAMTTKDGSTRVGIYCPSKASCFIQWVAKRAAHWSRDEITWALRHLPHTSSSRGMIIPEPKYTELLLHDTTCIGCIRQKATHLVLGWSKHHEPIKTYICVSCKEKLREIHASRKRRYQRR